MYCTMYVYRFVAGVTLLRSLCSEGEEKSNVNGKDGFHDSRKIATRTSANDNTSKCPIHTVRT